MEAARHRNLPTDGAVAADARTFVVVDYVPATEAGQSHVGQLGREVTAASKTVTTIGQVPAKISPITSPVTSKLSVTSVQGLIQQFRPRVILNGGFVEGETVTARIIFPDLPSDHPPVTMRFVTQWQREQIGTYWLTHGEAMARAKLRQRGHYEAVGEQSFFIPGIDTEPLDAKCFLPIECEEMSPLGVIRKRPAVNTLEYECSRHDIGCRKEIPHSPVPRSFMLRLVCQAVDLCGNLSRVFNAATPYILCPFPHVRSMHIRDAQTGLLVPTNRVREAAEAMAPTDASFNVPVRAHTLHLVVDYVGGDEGDSIVKWYRVAAAGPQQADRGVSLNPQTSPTLLAQQTRQYTVTKDDVGQQLCVTFTPVRADGIVGHPVTLFTNACSSSCPYSSIAHVHVHGVCPFQLSMVDVASKKKREYLSAVPPVR